MNCSNITTGYCGSLCHNNSGGIAEIFVTNKSNIDAITYNADESIADITLNHNTHWYYVVPNVESSNWVETVVSEESNNVLYYEQTISIVLGSTQQALRNFIESTASLPLAFIILDDNGRYFYFDDSRLNGGETGSGTSWSDLNGATLEYYSRSKEPIFEADVEHSTNLKEDLEDAKNPNPPVQPEHYIHYVSSVPLSGVWIDTNTDRRFNTWDDSTGDGYVYIYDGVTTIGGSDSDDYSPFHNNTSVTLIDIVNTEFTTIGDFAFRGCTNLTDFAYGENITSFGNYCFYQCESIPNFEFSDNVESIGQYAFYSCSDLADVSIGTGIENISSNAFAYTALTSFDVPSTITAISPFLLKGTPIASITIPSNILSVGRGAFQDCSLLTSVAIPNSVENIYNDAFNGCSLLDSLSIGNSVEMIGNGAFEDCSAIEELTLPDSLELIGQNAFYGCDDLMSVYIERETPPILVEGNFTATGDTLYVPYSLLDVYTDSSAWRNAFTFIRPDGYSYVNVVAGENGSVSGSGWYLIGSTITISATADSHYHFTAWNDGDTNATRSITVGSSDVTFTASFAIDRFLINVGVNDSDYGTVTGTGYYDYGTQVTISATPNEHYHFTQWQDGDVTNPRTVTVTSNMTFVATLAIDTFVLTVNTDSSYGSTTGSGTYAYGTQVQIEATPNEHYHFTAWNDGVATNPRTVTVTANATYTASIAIDRFLINVGVNDSDYGTVTGTGYYDYGTQVAISATPNEHYHFSQWQDGNTDNPRTITVTGNASYVATLAVDTFTLSVSANDASYGTTTGSGTYEYGTSVQISASPNVGYLFMQWNDGIANNPRTITVTGNASYVATFAVRNVYPIPYVGDIAVSGRWVNDNTNTNRNTYDVSTGDGVIYVYDDVTTIGGSRSTDDSPFYGSSVTEVDLNGANITNIDDYAFADSSLTDLYIDSSVPPTLGTDVFDSSVTVHVPYEYLSEYESDWGSVVDVVSDDKVILYTSGNQASGNWVTNNTDTAKNTYDALTGDGVLYLNDGVTVIGRGFSKSGSPFYQDASLTAVNLDYSGLTVIGYGAFQDCTSLASATIPNGVSGIEEWTFTNCSSLTSINIPNSVTSLGTDAFQDCTSLASATIGTGVINIGSDCFRNTGLTSITIPNNVTSLGTNAFNGCTSLVDVTLGTGITYITGYMFYGCTSLASINIPDNVTIIYSNAFNGCTSLASVTLGTGVTTIGDYAFYQTGLTSITIPNNVTSLGTNAFNGCTSLASATIGTGVTTISEFAFAYCTSLTNVTIGSNVTSIDDSAFQHSGLTSITLPANVTKIEDYAFDCSVLTSVTCEALTVPTLGVANFTASNDTLYVHVSVLADYQADSSWNGAFTTIATIEKVIRYNAGTQATGNWVDNNTITALNTFDALTGDGVLYLNDNVTTIGGGESTDYSPFYQKADLVSVDLSDSSISTVGVRAFYDCSTLVSANIDGVSGEIMGRAFNGCKALTSIDIPSGVTSIGLSAFENCTALDAIDIPSGVTLIGTSAFGSCAKLRSVTVRATTPPTLNSGNFNTNNNTLYVPESAFNAYTSDSSWNGAFTNISVITDDKVISYKATTQASGNWVNNNTITASNKFNNDRGVLYLNDNVTSIGGGNTTDYTPFVYSDVVSVDFSDSSITTFADSAIRGNSNLTSIILPSGLTTIANSVFYNCTALEAIDIPSGVTSIGTGAFGSCTKLRSVAVRATTPPTLSTNNFGASSDTLHVPSASVSTYRSNSSWNSVFTTITSI